jgi:diacylglycerol kinase family enzyme
MSRPRDVAALVVNRSARRAHGTSWLAEVRARLAARFHVEPLYPRDAEDTAATAHAASRDGSAVVIAAGGDGTIHAVANGLAASGDDGATLGILPLGTANDLAHELGLPTDPGAAAQRIVGGRAVPTDLVRVDGRHFCTVGGLGLVSASTRRVERKKSGGTATRAATWLLGSAVWKVAPAASLLARRIVSRMRVTWRDPDDGVERTQELDAHALFVTNFRRCGGGLVVPSGADAHDGVFELAFVPATHRARLLVNFARLAANRPLAPGVLTVLRADRATIETEREDAFVADGDVLSWGTRFEIEARRGAVRVVR